MTDSTLTSFIDAALRVGASRGEVERVLRDAGWSAEQIDAGLALFADVPFLVPVPRPREKPSARDAFRYLLTFAMLHVAAWHLWSLLSRFVDLLSPDGLEGRGLEPLYQDIRWATAALIVSFPVFLYTSRLTLREIAVDPSRRRSPLRRWLTYLTLFVAAAIIVGDLIFLLFNLLSGGLTVRFVAKSAIIGVITGGIFGYYLWSVRTDGAVRAR